MQVEYKVGDQLLAEWPYLTEVEIEEVSQTAQALKIRGSGCKAETFHPTVTGISAMWSTKVAFSGRSELW